MDTCHFFETLDQLFAEKRMDEAETYMQAQLDQAKAKGDHSAIITLCSELGGYYRVTSRYDAAKALYETALRELHFLQAENTEACGTTLINYATTCTMSGDLQKALALYAEAAEIFRGEAYAADYRLATLYNNISMLYQQTGQYAQAQAHLDHALRILRQLQDSDQEIAITYTNLANLYLAQNQIDAAQEAANLSLTLFDRLTGDRDVHYAAALCALGEVAERQGAPKKAAVLFQRAMELTLRDFGENDHYHLLMSKLTQCTAGKAQP